MFEAFVLTVLVVLALLGISELMHLLCLAVLKPKKPALKMLVTILSEEDAEQQLMQVTEELKWSGSNYADGIIAVTALLSDEKREYCRSRYEVGCVHFTDKFDITEGIKKFRSIV